MDVHRDGPDPDAWRIVDEGWGRRAAEFATLSEPSNVREYVALQHRLGITDGDRVLDLACGSGLALELASLRGATVAGIDASARLIAIARDRLPGGDVRVGDMHELPWEDHSFDVVTSFRGIWGTTPQALAEARRVLVPGGRLGFTVWGHIKKSPGAWALAPFRLASEPKVENQAAMVALGRPGAGEELLARFGFEDVERMVVPFAWEFPDPESYARALATTGPAYEAIQAVGEDEFLRRATEIAQEHVREGLPLRAEIDVVGYTARAPQEDAGTWPHDNRSGSFLAAPGQTADVRRLYDEDAEDLGYVMNASRLWGHLPAEHRGALRADRCCHPCGRPQRPGARHPGDGDGLHPGRLLLRARLGWQARGRRRRRHLRRACSPVPTRASRPPSWPWPGGPAGSPPIRTPRCPRMSTSCARRGTTTRRSSRSRSTSGCGSRSPP